MKHLEDNLIVILGDDYNKIIGEKDDFSRAIRLIEKLYRHQKDKSGYPALDHLYSVSNNCPNTGDEKIVALLHDVLEDTSLTYTDLRLLGFSKDIVDTIYILTRQPNEDYKSYIHRIIASNNKVALEVKKQDMLNNSSKERLEKSLL